MEQTMKIKVLTEWKDITLRKYLEMMADVDSYKDDQDAIDAIMLHHLAGIPYEHMQNISVDSFNVLKEKLSKFIEPTEMPLQKFILIDGDEYGFEPNLSKMTYGAYADISKYDTISIDKNWANIMSILYRPVTKKDKHGLYQIKHYDGEINPERWMDITMDVHFGCLFFFLHLQMDLMRDTLKSLTEKELPHNMHTDLVRSGEVMQRYMNLQMGTLKDLTQ